MNSVRRLIPVLVALAALVLLAPASPDGRRALLRLQELTFYDFERGMPLLDVQYTTPNAFTVSSVMPLSFRKGMLVLPFSCLPQGSL